MTLFTFVLLAIVLIILLYWALPEVLFHYARVGVAGHGPDTVHAVALTFDDGPGEATEAVLDALRSAKAHATFFVVAERAQRYPELIRRMVAEGHEVASHGYQHRSAWLLGPIASARQARAAAARIAKLSGQSVRRMRPPWGHFNLPLAVALRSAGLVPSLWSADPGDWRSEAERPREMLLQKAVQAAEPGAVYLLHDSGGDGRRRTAEILPDLLSALEARGLHAVTMDELYAEGGRLRSRAARLAHDLWEAWERVFARLQKSEDVGSDPMSILALALVRYRGEAAVTDDGVALVPGQPAAEVHFLSEKMARLGALRAATAMVKSLRNLAGVLAHDERYADVQVLFGMTLMYRMANRFGFSVRDVRSSWRRRATGAWLRWLLLLYSREGRDRLKRRPEFLEDPKLALISRQELLRRYGPKQREGRERG